MKLLSGVTGSKFVRALIWPFIFIWSRILRLQSYITASPTRLFGAFLFAFVAWYASTFILPQPVQFAYAGQTCVSHVTLFPGSQRQLTGKDFTIRHTDTFGVGSWRALSTKTCFDPAAPPAEGKSNIKTALFGMSLFADTFRLDIPHMPKIMQSQEIIPIAVTKPLTLPLTNHDEVFSYAAEVADKTQHCVVAAHAELTCRLDKLGLEQGNEYSVAVGRSFAGKRIDTVATALVKILPATNIIKSSIDNGAVVYDAPKQLTLEADKPLADARIILAYGNDANTTEVPIKPTIDGKTLTVAWDTPLPREQTYHLIVSSLEATDGSTLASPYVLQFSTSGGPKVKSVSIRTSNVALGTTAIVTFDQKLAEGQSIANFASISGGSATIRQRNATQISFTLDGMSPCNAFTLSVKAGLVGENGVVSKDAWSFSSRMTCRVRTETIGYSVRGRALTAYYYGTGSKTILFTGGIHGTEPSGVYIMQDWVSYLDSNGYKIPADRQVVVVPNLNPDGIAAGTRYNANNVNLDRNFPTSDWSSDIDTASGIIKNGGGTAPLSEPEAKAIASLTSRLHPRLVMSYHAKGSLVGINGFSDSRAIGTLYTSTVGYTPMFDNAVQIMGYSFTGEYELWIGEALGVPAVLIELPTYYGHYLNAHLSALWKMVNI